MRAISACERCSAAEATVQLSRTPLNSGDVQAVASRFCRSCAIELGVPTPAARTVASSGESPFGWAELRTFVTHLEQALRVHPEMREKLSTMAQQIPRAASRLPAPMPPTIAAALAKLGVRTS